MSNFLSQFGDSLLRKELVPPYNPEEYYYTVNKVYELLAEMHEELAQKISEALDSPDVDEARRILEETMDIDILAQGFRARRLCDRIDKESHAIFEYGTIDYQSEAGQVISNFLGRERGAAQLYTEELGPLLVEAMGISDIMEMKSFLENLRTNLLAQRGQFLESAARALEEV